MSTVSSDGKTVHKLTCRKLLGYGFSRDGAQVFGIFHNAAGEGAEWQLLSMNALANRCGEDAGSSGPAAFHAKRQLQPASRWKAFSDYDHEISL